jgi:hypothetical protein
MRANGNLLLIAADTAGLLTYSVSNPMVPALLSQFQPSSAVDGVTVDGNLALLAAADGGFVIADMTNPAAPVLAGRFPEPLVCFADLDPAFPPGLVSVFANNAIAYLGSFAISGRAFGFDYHQPAHPRFVSAAFYGNAIDESVLPSLSPARTYSSLAISIMTRSLRPISHSRETSCGTCVYLRRSEPMPGRLGHGCERNRPSVSLAF